MSGWIKIEKSLESDPRTLRVARTLSKSLVTFCGNADADGRYDPCNAVAFHYVTLVCGALARLWIYADTHIREDDTLDMGPAEIDDWVGIPNFCAALPEDWLRVVDDGTVELPGFQAHNGVEAKKKASTQKRVERHRTSARNASALQAPEPCNAPALPDQTRPDQTRPLRKVPSEPLSSDALDGADGGAVERVFDHWRTTHQHPQAKLDEKRRRLIRAALKTYSEADLCQAITGYRNSPHHMGQNDRSTVYDAIELMLRDAKHIDAGLRFARDPPRTDLSSLTRRNVAAVENWVPPELRAAQ